MIRTTQLDIQGAEVESKYSITEGKINWVTVNIDGVYAVADWMIDVTAIRESLEDHHANLLLEENIDET